MVGKLYIVSGFTLIILSALVPLFLDLLMFEDVFRFAMIGVGVILIIAGHSYFFVREVKITPRYIETRRRLIGIKRKVHWHDVEEIFRRYESQNLMLRGVPRIGRERARWMTNAVYALRSHGGEFYLYSLEEFDSKELVQLHKRIRNYCVDYGINCRM
ncbi:MAG: hypothetical protein R6U61_07080 [Thermoplasmata archaeon]